MCGRCRVFALSRSTVRALTHADRDSCRAPLASSRIPQPQPHHQPWDEASHPDQALIQYSRFCSWQPGVDMLFRQHYCFATILVATGERNHQNAATTYAATLIRNISVTRLLLVTLNLARSMEMLSYAEKEGELWV